MRKIYLPVICTFILLCGTAAPVFSDAASDAKSLLKSFSPVMPDLTSPKNYGMGGYHAAYRYNEIETLFSNPAALGYIKDPRWSFSASSMNFSGPFFDIMGALVAGTDVIDNVVSLIDKSGIKNLSLNMSGPLAFGFSGPNLAFGLYNRTFVKLAVPSITQTTFCAGEELMITCGYGDVVFETERSSLSAGISFDGFMQAVLYKQGTLTEMSAYASDFDINNSPALFVSGLRFNVGLLYNFAETFFTGITWYNPYSFISASVFENFKSIFSTGDSLGSAAYTQDSDLTIGIGWAPEFKLLEQYVTRFDLMLDYHRLLELFPGYTALPRNPILNFSFGAEIVIHHVLSLRLGINDCYLAAGLGLDLSWVTIDFAAYGSELGVQPGQMPCYNLAFSLSFLY